MKRGRKHVVISKIATPLKGAETRGGIKDGDSSKRGQKHVVVSKMATPVKEGGNTWWYQRWRLYRGQKHVVI
jgi:hypothetical protein